MKFLKIPKSTKELPHSTSDLLEKIANDALADVERDDTPNRITVGEFIDQFAERGFGIIILLCAIPNLLPVNVPGISLPFSVVIVFFTTQWMLNYKHPWLPSFVRKRDFEEQAFANAVLKVTPHIRTLEKVIKPRGAFMEQRAATILIGCFILGLTFVLALPLSFIPFSNTIPAVFIALIAIGIIERDGWLILGSVIAGIIAHLLYSVVVIAGVTYVWNKFIG